MSPIEVRPDIAFEVRQNIKTKSELIWLSFHLKLEAWHFLFWDMKHLVIFKVSNLFSKFQIAARDKSGGIYLVLVCIIINSSIVLYYIFAFMSIYQLIRLYF